MKKNTDILNKLKSETTNTGVVHLWLEGMFWKAYEHSAYLFVCRVSGYKPYKKWVKAVGGEVVAIGFPVKVFDKLIEGRTVEWVDDKHCVFQGFTMSMQEIVDFREWKKKIPSFPFHAVMSEKSTDLLVANTDVLTVASVNDAEEVKPEVLTTPISRP